MTREFLWDGRRIAVRIEKAESGEVVSIDGGRYEFAVMDLGGGHLACKNSEGGFYARAVRERDRIWVWLNGRTFEFRLPGSDPHDASAGGEPERNVCAPMPGTLVRLLVAAGDAVEEGQVVAVVEAMKMEHQLRSPRCGVVETVSGDVGSIVDAGTTIVSLSPAAGSDGVGKP
jgi:acetyl/propionyl-CoA carboxylase alpha subunit